MSVNWSWKDRVGTIKWKQYDNTYNVSIYNANCLCCFLWEFLEGETEKYNFMGFFNDEQHAKNCFGLTKDFKENLYKSEWLEVEIDAKWCNVWKLAKLLAKAKIPVKIIDKDFNLEEKDTLKGE